MFLSYGPKFQQKKEIEPFANIELYNLMCGKCFPLKVKKKVSDYFEPTF